MVHSIYKPDKFIKLLFTIGGQLVEHFAFLAACHFNHCLCLSYVFLVANKMMMMYSYHSRENYKTLFAGGIQVA